ncbi:S1C family serine protease [Sanguibacter suarezii]|uniref:S1C family serine protease n=1 Tax=Sanguibacter suarezii TaxID=60921 RepID=UPI00082C7CDC|nr:trypsin-like peptidase domain-containing protein [Sanguibacter suarezii]
MTEPDPTARGAAEPVRLPPVPLPPGHPAPSYAVPSYAAPSSPAPSSAAASSPSPYEPHPDHARYAPVGATSATSPDSASGSASSEGSNPSSGDAPGSGDPTAEQWAGVQTWFGQSGHVDPVPGQPRAKAPRSRGVGAGTVVVLLIAALVMGAVGGVAGQRAWEMLDPSPGQPLPAITPNADITRPDGSIADIAATVAPSVVSIHVAGADGQGTGSGFIIREDGYILTNNHVIAGAVPSGTIRVTFVDGSEEDATLIGRTSDYDIAVIRVDRDGLTPLVLGDSDTVVVGDPVIAIGAPLGLDGTVTSGIISALNRPVSAGDSSDTAFINALQTDAAINPGNSGGPLVNGAGQVIGINSAIAQPPGTMTAAGNIGLGFAIGSNQARRTADEIIETGSATYPIIGVLLDSSYDGEGVQVVTAPQNGQDAVTPGGPADAAGIVSGDVILEVDGRPVTQSDQLIVAIRAKAPGDTVVLRVRSGNDERDVPIVLSTATSEED